MSLDGILNQPENDLDVVIITDDELEGAFDELGRTRRGSSRRNRFRNRVKRGMRSLPKKGRTVATNNLTPKAEFEKRITMMPEVIQKELKNSRLQIVDGNIYSLKSISNLSAIELLENKDDKTVGVTNLNGRKLDANQYFLVTGIIITYGVAEGITVDAVKATNYNQDLPAIIKNGEFNLALGSEVLIPEIAGDSFNTKGRTDVQMGYYKLANPKWLKPLMEIKPELKMAGVATENAAIKFQLIGATLAKK